MNTGRSEGTGRTGLRASHRMPLVFLVGALCGVVGASARQQVRDAAPVAAAAGSISGRILVAGTDKQPARRVRVTLTDLARTIPGQTTTTDDTGAFSFTALPAGRFEIQAFRNAYLRTSYGASRPERPGTPIVLKAGEAVTNVSMTIARGGVISGIVRDPRGRPIPNINVRVLRLGYNALTGERTLGAPSSGASTTTDDRGRYRAYGLPPGGYYVAVPGNDAGRSGGPGGPDDLRQITSEEVRRILQQPAGMAGGTPASGRPATPPPPPVRVNYAPVFHPGVTDIGAATTIALGLSEERTDADVTVQLVPTANITGRLTSQSGTAVPAGLSIGLVPAGPFAELLAGSGVRVPSAQPRPDGTFTFSGIPPGSYTLKAQIGRGRLGSADAPVLWASAPVTMTGQDMEVSLVLQPGIQITGRVVFEGAQPTPADLQTMTLFLMAPGSGGSLTSGGGAGGRVDAEGRFTFLGITPDSYRFAYNWTAPTREKWALKTAVANGREAFEAPLQVNQGEPVTWTVTFTDKPTALEGVFQDRSGRAATDYFILIYSVDRGTWIPGSRRIRTTRPATDGAFSVKGVPAGEYYLAALTDLENGEWNDPALLERLIQSSIKVTLRDGEVTTQDVRIGG
jgi:hypothetical protein